MRFTGAKIGQKTHRGMQGLALRDFIREEGASAIRPLIAKDGSAQLEINLFAIAEIINRIYRLYAEAGFSMKRIAIYFKF